MQQLQLDEFLRSLKQNIDMPHSLLLGAGASIESGVQSATECIWYWKKEIYLSQNPGAIGNYSNSKLEIVRQVIQKWIDSQNGYPALNSDEEYFVTNHFANSLTYAQKVFCTTAALSWSARKMNCH